VEEAVTAYQAHDRVVAADSKPAVTLALLQDWWTAWQQAEQDPAQEVVVLAARGRLGGERLQVEDRQLAVGDRVVCGKNAAMPVLAKRSSGSSTRLPRMVVWLSAAICSAPCSC
jgi:hypothetical protein